ncbi:MAG: NADH-quinone oxidoreductase subunit N, partial [Acidimicrobiia bacterium]
LTVTSLGLAAGWGLIERLGRRGAEALALALLAAAGFQLMAASEHLVMIFLGLEVGSISLYVLAGITRERPDSDEAAMKYFLLGSLASAVFIYGVALVYAGTGALDLIAQRAFLDQFVLTRPGVLLVGLGLVISGLAFKVTAAPFHSWAPDVYQGAPAGIVGLMAAGAKIGGFAALMRILFTAFPQLSGDWGPIVAALATMSMVVGTLLAIVQDDVRRMLAYSGVAHAGFILTGVVAGAAGSPEVWFYLTVYTVQLVGAFAVVAAVAGPSGSRSALLTYSGLAARSPFLAGAFSVLLLGMAGLPLTSGFVAKFGVFTDAWRGGYPWLVVVAVLASVAAFFFYLRVMVLMYMADPEEGGVVDSAPGIRWVLGVAVAATFLLGIVPGPLLELVGNVVPI